jgi:hypothetical protein
VRSGASAAEHDRHAGVALYNGASVLIRTHRNPVLAAKMLEDYLALSYKSEEAPAFIAHLWLAQLKQQLGDAEAAKQETATAQSMARDYRPAPDSRQ